MMNEKDKTITFSIKDEKDLEIKRVLHAVYSADQRSFRQLQKI